MREKIDSISIVDEVETVVKDIGKLVLFKTISSTHNKITDWFWVWYIHLSTPMSYMNIDW